MKTGLIYTNTFTNDKEMLEISTTNLEVFLGITTVLFVVFVGAAITVKHERQWMLIGAAIVATIASGLFATGSATALAVAFGMIAIGCAITAFDCS